MKATISSPESPIYNFFEVKFFDCDVVLKATGNSSYPVVRYVGEDMIFGSTPEAAILAPYGAKYDKSAKSIVSSSGSSIYNQDIYISN